MALTGLLLVWDARETVWTVLAPGGERVRLLDGTTEWRLRREARASLKHSGLCERAGRVYLL